MPVRGHPPVQLGKSILGVFLHAFILTELTLLFLQLGHLLHLFFETAMKNRDAAEQVEVHPREVSSQRAHLAAELARAHDALKASKVKRDLLYQGKAEVEASLTAIEATVANL